MKAKTNLALSQRQAKTRKTRRPTLYECQTKTFDDLVLTADAFRNHESSIDADGQPIRLGDRIRTVYCQDRPVPDFSGYVIAIARDWLFAVIADPGRNAKDDQGSELFPGDVFPVRCHRVRVYRPVAAAFSLMFQLEKAGEDKITADYHKRKGAK